MLPGLEHAFRNLHVDRLGVLQGSVRCRHLHLVAVTVILHRFEGQGAGVWIDASFLGAMERRLKHAGYEVVTYASAQHLLDRLPSESAPGCILLDVRLPGLTGPELQERLNELGSTLPIIFITGYPDVRTTVKTVKAGADDFLTKPVSSEDLLVQLRGRLRIMKRRVGSGASGTWFALVSRH